MTSDQALNELQRMFSMPEPRAAIWDALPRRTREIILEVSRPAGLEGLTEGKAAELTDAELTTCWSALRELAERATVAVRQLEASYDRHCSLLAAAHPIPAGKAA